MFISILQTRNLRLRKVKLLACGYTASKILLEFEVRSDFNTYVFSIKPKESSTIIFTEE